MKIRNALKSTLAPALAFGMLFAIAAEAQDTPDRDGPKKRFHRGDIDPAAALIEQLGLDEDQAAQVETLFAEAEEDRAALREAHLAENCELRDQVDQDLQGILTADQYAELEALKAEREARMAGRALRHGRDIGDRPERCG